MSRQHPLLYALREIDDVIAEQLAPALADAGLTTAHYHLLYILHEEGPSRLSELAAWQRCVRSNVTRLVAAMERMGLVERRPDPTDGRARLVTMSGQGREAFRRVSRVARRIEKRLAEGLGPERAETLAHLAMEGAGLLDR